MDAETIEVAPISEELPLPAGQLAPRWCICRQKDFECAETCGWKEYPDDH